jgi:hypothetical protein
MNFVPSGRTSEGRTLNASDYTPGANASGIYRVSEGKYLVILDNNVNLSGQVEGVEIANSASDSGQYIDVWTVKFTESSDYTTVIQKFKLSSNRFFTLTEPLLIKPNWKLNTKRFPLGTKQNIKIFTKIAIENKCIDSSIKNLFKESIIDSAQMQIVKINENINTLPSRVEVSGYSETSPYIDITADNTVILNWATNELLTHAQTLAGNMGNLRGLYEVRLKATILNEVIVSEPMFLQVY